MDLDTCETNKEWEKLLKFYKKFSEYSETWDGEPLPEEIPLFRKGCPIEMEELEEYTEWYETEENKLDLNSKDDTGFELRLSNRMKIFIKFSNSYAGPKFYLVPDFMSSSADRLSLRPSELERLCLLMDKIKRKMIEVCKNADSTIAVFPEEESGTVLQGLAEAKDKK